MAYARRINFSCVSLTLLGAMALNGHAAGEGQSHSALQTKITQAAAKLGAKLIEAQKPDGSWEGDFEADPSVDAMLLAFGKETGLLSEDVLREKVQRISDWREREKQDAWNAYPGGPPSVDITGIVLLALAKVGYGKDDPRLASAWKWFEAQGGVKSINLINQMMMAPLGLVPASNLQAFFQVVNVAAHPSQMQGIGIAKTLLVPLTVWYRYSALKQPQEKSDVGHQLSPVNPLKNAKILVNTFSTGRRARSRGIASEGLTWILDRQDAAGQWYTVYQTLVCGMALLEAQRAGIDDYSDRIKAAWKGLEAWRRSPRPGSSYTQVTSSAGWDTPKTLTALEGLPALRSQYQTQILKGKEWVRKHQLPAGGWSFSPYDRFYPDADDAAASIEALLLTAQTPEERKSVTKGIQWILDMQNDDGGFPSWEKNVKPLFSAAMQKVFNTPDMTDVSQVDITSRVLKMFVDAKAKPQFAEAVEAQTFHRVCEFLRNSAKTVFGESSVPLWKGDWMANYLYGSSEAVEAMLSAQCATASVVKAQVAWILSKQQSDGGWGESHESYLKPYAYVAGPTTVSQTAWVLRALIAYEKAARGQSLPGISETRTAIERGLEFILSRIKASGRIAEREHTGISIKGYWTVRYDLLPQYEALRTFNAYLDLNSEGQAGISTEAPRQ